MSFGDPRVLRFLTPPRLSLKGVPNNAVSNRVTSMLLRSHSKSSRNCSQWAEQTLSPASTMLSAQFSSTMSTISVTLHHAICFARRCPVSRSICFGRYGVFANFR